MRRMYQSHIRADRSTVVLPLDLRNARKLDLKRRRSYTNLPSNFISTYRIFPSQSCCAKSSETLTKTFWVQKAAERAKISLLTTLSDEARKCCGMKAEHPIFRRRQNLQKPYFFKLKPISRTIDLCSGFTSIPKLCRAKKFRRRSRRTEAWHISSWRSVAWLGRVLLSRLNAVVDNFQGY